MPAPPGQYVALNLGPRFTGPGSHVPLNLGVNWWDDGPDPPDPVVRGLQMSAGLSWGRGALRRLSIFSGWQQAARRSATGLLRWSLSVGVGATTALPWAAPPRLRGSAGMPWRPSMASRRAGAVLPWAALPIERRSVAMVWGSQRLMLRGAALQWLAQGTARIGAALPWRAMLRNQRGQWQQPWLNPGLARRAHRLPWGLARQLPWLVRPPVPPAPDPDPSPFPPGNRVALNLGCAVIGIPGLAPLNLGVTACYAVRPQRETHIVLNTVSVVRLPDRTPIAVESVGISSSVDAWGCSFDIGLADSAHLALLKPTAAGPRQIEITLNGYVWTAIIEHYSTRREYSAGGVSLTGRSRTALLAAPYAPARARVSTEARSMAQLVGEELADTGYTATYDTVDWLVPEGAWFYDAATPLDAIGTLAEASGGVVQSHPETLELHVRPRYPVSPWDWPDSAPDAVIQDDIVLGENLQVRSAPLYDAVVVTGELAGKGVTCKVRRAGEAGNLYAPQVSNPLISEAAAGAERGRNVLSDRGEQAAIDLTLPLFAAPLLPGQTGRVLPLDLVEVQAAEGTWQGLCTAVRIEARMDDKAVVIEQTVTLERHYTDAN